MINDPHAILLGLYREAESMETDVSNSNFVRKKLKILGEFYILEEEKIQGKHLWNLYVDNSKEPLEREDVLSLYARANFKRHENPK
jgi:hypothetical protein